MKRRPSANGSARADLVLVPPLDDYGHELDLAVGDVVVYASHGLGRVEARVGGAGDPRELVVLSFESGLRVTLPIDRAVDALRAPSGELELEDVQRTLRGTPAARIAPWAARFRTMREKVAAGEVTGLAEVVRDCAGRERKTVDARGGQAAGATGERGLYLQARKLLAAEIAFARGIDASEADAWTVEQTSARPSE